MRASPERKAEMQRRYNRRTVLYQQFNTVPVGFVPAYLNWRTLQPHENAREIARNNKRSIV